LPIPRPLLRATATLPFVISTEAKRSGEICGLPIPRPLLPAKATLPFVISTEAKRSGEICGLPIPRPLMPAKATLPFVISTEAKRSGEICGLAVLSWKCFATDRSVLEKPAVPLSPRTHAACKSRNVLNHLRHDRNLAKKWALSERLGARLYILGTSCLTANSVNFSFATNASFSSIVTESTSTALPLRIARFSVLWPLVGLAS
jgi:hypothetical protein